MLNKKNVIIVGALVIIIVALVIAFKSFTIRSVNPDGMVATNGLPAIGGIRTSIPKTGKPHLRGFESCRRSSPRERQWQKYR